MSTVRAASVGVILLALSIPAQAQVYKYTKKDGTVVYTDQLSELPKKVRAKYRKREEKKARERAQLEASLGKAEVERLEREAKRRRELELQMARAERQRRKQEIAAVLATMREKNAARNAKKAAWQKRLAKAKEAVQTLFAEYKKTQEAYSNLAVRADFALFPGQNKKKEELRKKLAEVEKKLDAALYELNVKIPQDARKQGIPPGWLR